MKNFPFSVYDSFAYLATGLIVLTAADYSLDLGRLARRETSALQLLVIVVFAYSIGHVIAYVAGVGIEQHILARRLNRTSTTILEARMDLTHMTACDSETPCTAVWAESDPTNQVFAVGDVRMQLRNCRYATAHHDEAQTCPARQATHRLRVEKWRKHLFGFHFKPISTLLRDRLLQAAERDGVRVTSLFNHAWMTTRADPITLDRSSRFLNQYGFCRNMIIATLAAGFMVAIRSARPFLAGGPPDTEAAILAVSSLPIAYVFVFRYLDFLKRYEFEIYASYAYHVAISLQPTQPGGEPEALKPAELTQGAGVQL